MVEETLPYAAYAEALKRAGLSSMAKKLEENPKINAAYLVEDRTKAKFSYLRAVDLLEIKDGGITISGTDFAGEKLPEGNVLIVGRYYYVILTEDKARKGKYVVKQAGEVPFYKSSAGSGISRVHLIVERSKEGYIVYDIGLNPVEAEGNAEKNFWE